MLELSSWCTYTKESSVSSETLGNIKPKDYSKFSDKKLNKILKLRARQINVLKSDGYSATTKSLGQLQYEHDAIVTEMLERSMKQ